MRKRLYLLPLSCVLLCTGCSGFSSQDAPKPSLITADPEAGTAADSAAEIRDENRDFSTALSIADYRARYVYDGAPIPLTYRIKNGGQAFDYAFLVFVNGKQTPYSTAADSEERMTHQIHLSAESEAELTLYLEPRGCRKGETALCCIEAMLNPDYMLPDTSYVSFTPHHSLNGTAPFSVEIRADAPDADSAVSDMIADAAELTPELEKPYIYELPMTHETVNRLDSMTLLECFQNDPLEPYMQAEETLSLTVRGAGVSGKYLVGVYVDHRLQKAFDGCEYAVLDVDRKMIRTLHPTVDLRGMTGLHHIYMIAVPYDPEQPAPEPIKTATKLLQIAGEQTGLQDQTELPGQTDTPQSGTEPASAGVGEVMCFGVLPDGTVLSRTADTVTATAPDGTVSGSAPVSYMTKMQLLDSGFAVIDSRSAVIRIYDEACRQIREIHPPQHDDAHYAVSADGRRIAYSYRDTESSICYLMTDSIDLDDPKTVLQIALSDRVGELQGIDQLIAYREGRIAYTGAVLRQRQPREDYAACCGAAAEDGSGNWYHTPEKLQFPSVNLSAMYGAAHDFVILQDYDSPGRQQGRQVYLYAVADGTERAVTCQSADETHNAALSADGKYLMTLNEAQHTLQVYDTESGRQIWCKSPDAYVSMINICAETETVYWLESGTLKTERFTEGTP